MNQCQRLFDLTGKVALVTGGSRGIGRMIAEAYVRAGARVYVSSRKADACAETAAALSQHGTCIAVPADLSRSSELESLTAALREREPALHILVNNAGATWGAALETFPEEGWERVMNVNLKSVFFLIQKLLPLLDRAGTVEDPSRVINVGSVDGTRVSPFETYSYMASKAGLHHLSRSLAERLARRHITVNVLAPGPFETRMMAGVLAESRTAVEERVPLGRIGGADDIAGPALLLASRAGAYITGAVLPVDGGLSGCV
jgi:NAD(P)-dependent dehydrogenase (short-subunit alcohol dehydrogenase family)